MRTAAGILLIVTSLFNVFAGMTGLACGGAATAIGVAGGEFVKENTDTVKDAEGAQRGLRKATLVGGTMMGYGFYLLVVSGLEIAAAVQLFRMRSRAFVLVVALLALVAEGFGIALTGFKPLLNGVGIVGAILAVLAVRNWPQGASQT